MKSILPLGLLFIIFHTTAQDISVDKKLGAENAILVEQEMGIYYHDSLYKLVNDVGNKLVAQLTNNPFEFKFFLADSQEPNAFALPGGYVYVTRGILPLIQTEDELAGIMAHEIIHVTQRHTIKQMKKGVFGNILQVPGNLINAVTGTGIGNILNAPIALTQKAFLSKYSRGHESEADALGIQLAAKAGYKMDALADALNRLSKGIELMTGKAEKHNYFSDHPMTPMRITAINDKTAKTYSGYVVEENVGSQDGFLRKFTGLCYGENPQQGVFIDSLFVHPDIEFSWIIPSKWQKINKPTAVAAASEKGDAVVILSTTEEKRKAREIGEEAKQKIASAQNTQVKSARDTTINSIPAYVLRVVNYDRGNKKTMELIWIDFQEKVFFLAGISLPGREKITHDALCSFKRSTSAELNSVKLMEVELVTSRNNETIGQLSERTENKLALPMTSLYNNIVTDASLGEGLLIKIVRSRMYKPSR